MAEKPVAVRITRPYDSEDEFLTGDIDTLTRTTVLLVGAQKRPDGVVLRFEITLRNGTALVRGEGRVVAYKENAHAGEPGLLLRFTRLDSKSKALVDRASVRREEKRASIRPPPPAASPLPPPPAERPSDVEIPVTHAAPEASPIPPPPDLRPADPPPSSAPSISVSVVSSPALSVASPSSGTPIAMAAPPDREAILDRLRTRAKTLKPDQVEAILKARGT
jgi:hypothetical protein